MSLPSTEPNAFSAATGAEARQHDLFQTLRPPVLPAWGAGVDSTAMLIELVESGHPPDGVLFADAGGEHPETYRFIPIFMGWLLARGVLCEIVRYRPKDFKNYPEYHTLEENCLTNGTLPSKAFGFGSCSAKWKVEPQNRWAEAWSRARAIWAVGGKVVKLIGYNCSPQDQARYAEREGYNDPRYEYRYPLREWGWDRAACVARIVAAGWSVPRKSACFFCPVTKPHELHTMAKGQLRRIVLMEARARPRLRTVEGLWRSTVKGCRGAVAHPGSMTAYIRAQTLLADDEIEAIERLAPQELVAWQEAVGTQRPRRQLSEWLDVFDASGRILKVDGLRNLYAHMEPAITDGSSNSVAAPPRVA
jgi:hypothetical protein